MSIRKLMVGVLTEPLKTVSNTLYMVIGIKLAEPLIKLPPSP